MHLILAGLVTWPYTRPASLAGAPEALTPLLRACLQDEASFLATQGMGGPGTMRPGRALLVPATVTGTHAPGALVSFPRDEDPCPSGQKGG